MARTQKRWVFALVLLFSVRSIWGELAVLGDSVSFTSNKTCGDGGEFKLIHRLKDDSARVVATRVGGVWMPGEGYKGRAEHRSVSRVALTRVNYNDDGLYEFTCGGRDVHRIQLEVLIPIDISVTDGETVPLPCHSLTAGKPVKLVRWERNGELVFEQDLSSGEVTNGFRFEGRASVSPDWNWTGDLTLTLERAQLEDQGNYICYTDKEGTRTRGNPDAVRMRVNEIIPDQTTYKPPPVSQTRPMVGTWPIVGIIAAEVCLLAAAFGIGWWLKSCTSKVPPGPGVEEPARDVAMRLLPDNNPADTQVDEEPQRLANGFVVVLNGYD